MSAILRFKKIERSPDGDTIVYAVETGHTHPTIKSVEGEIRVRLSSDVLALKPPYEVMSFALPTTAIERRPPEPGPEALALAEQLMAGER